jgi:hypothetical protein
VKIDLISVPSAPLKTSSVALSVGGLPANEIAKQQKTLPSVVSALH